MREWDEEKEKAEQLSLGYFDMVSVDLNGWIKPIILKTGKLLTAVDLGAVIPRVGRKEQHLESMETATCALLGDLRTLLHRAGENWRVQCSAAE